MEQEQGSADSAPRISDLEVQRSEARRLRDRQRYKGDRAVRARKTAAHYSRDHRPEISEKHRQDYRAKRQFGTPEELAECRADPRKAKTIRGRDWIVCLGRKTEAGAGLDQKCGQLLSGMLNNAHLREHGYKSAVEYKDEWGYDRKTALVSETLAAKLRARHRNPHIGEMGRAVLESYRRSGKKHHGPASLESRLNRSDRMRGIARPDLSKGMTDPEVVRRWLLKGQTAEEIATESGRTQNTVHVQLRNIFGVHVRLRTEFLHGEPVTDASINKLRENFGNLTRSQLAQRCKLPTSRLYSAGRRRKNQALVPERAKWIRDAEREFLGILKRDKGNQPNHLRVVVPGLTNKLQSACEAISLLRGYVGRETELGSVLEQLCAESRKEVDSGSGEFRARTILCWLPQVLAWLAANQPRLHRKSSELGLEFLADDYGFKGWVVKMALSPKHSGQTEQRIIRAMILAGMPPRRTIDQQSSPASIVKAKKTRGRPKGTKGDETQRRVLLAAALKLLGVTIYGMAPKLYPLNSARSRVAAEAATRHFLKRNASAIRQAMESLDDTNARKIAAAGMS